MNPIIRHHIDMLNDGDKWGTAMGAFFSIASAFYLNGGCDMGDTYLPWGFRASPLLQDDDAHRDEDWLMAELLTLLDEGTVTMPDLRHAGDVLHRYTNMLKTAGLDY